MRRYLKPLSNDRNARWQREWRRKNPELARERSRVANAKYRALHEEQYHGSALKYTRLLKFRAFDILGNKCARCDWIDPRALHIDHIHGGGTAERKTGIQTQDIYRFIVYHPEEAKLKYQLLCANHNYIKRWENKEFGVRRRRKVMMPPSFFEE